MTDIVERLRGHITNGRSHYALEALDELLVELEYYKKDGDFWSKQAHSLTASGLAILQQRDEAHKRVERLEAALRQELDFHHLFSPPCFTDELSMWKNTCTCKGSFNYDPDCPVHGECDGSHSVFDLTNDDLSGSLPS